MTHTYVRKAIIDSDNALSPVWCQAINLNQCWLSIKPLSVKFQSNFTHFHWVKCIWKCRQRNFDHFVSSSMNKHMNNSPPESMKIEEWPAEFFLFFLDLVQRCIRHQQSTANVRHEIIFWFVKIWPSPSVILPSIWFLRTLYQYVRE